MPQVIIPPGYAQVFWRFRSTGDAEEMLTSCGVRTIDSPPVPQNVANNMALAWTTSFPAGDLSNTYQFVGTRVYIGQDGDPLVAENNVIVAGTSSATFLPSNCALLIQKRTGVTGRRNRGRFYLPAGYLQESAVDQNGAIAGGSLTTYQGNADDLFTFLTTTATTTDQAVVLHSTAPSLPTPITSFVVPPKIATWRRRMRK